jgi:hypothetical protein
MSYDREKRREEYMAKLRDPRWQRMRLEVMNRDEFTCQSCFDKDATLNVHHSYYKQGKEPWDYPITALVTLCERCHQEETETRRSEEQALLEALRMMGMSASNVNSLASTLFSTFGEDFRFQDNMDYYLSRYIAHFWTIYKEVDALIKRKIAERDEAEKQS